MNSREVSKAIKGSVRPVLEEVGFTEFTARKAWRYLPDLVHVIDFQSLGNYTGQRLNTTSFSFGIEIGISFVAASKYPWFSTFSFEAPREYPCQLRKSLSKKLRQHELPRPDVWFVDPNGENLPTVIGDVRGAIVIQALPWLDKYSDKSRALKAFESKSDTFYEPGILDEHLGGVKGSLARARIASALALELGNKKRGIRNWEKLLKDPYYRSLDEIRGDAQSSIQWIIENYS